MRRQIGGEVVEQISIPRFVIHLIDRLDESLTEEPSPEAIDDRSRKAGIGRVGVEVGGGGVATGGSGLGPHPSGLHEGGEHLGEEARTYAEAVAIAMG